jgi:hypothetical protein
MTAISAINNASWSMEYLVDELYCNLVSYDTYPEQARSLIRKIPVTRQNAPFIIKVSDLSQKIQKALAQCTKRGRLYVLREAVARLFEEIDYYYTRLSVKPFLVVRLEK